MAKGFCRQAGVTEEGIMYIVDVKNPVGLQVFSFSYDVYTEVTR